MSVFLLYDGLRDSRVSFASKQEKYRWFIEALRHKVDIENLVGVLELISDMIREVVRDELTGVKAVLAELSGEVRDIKGLLERVADSTGELEGKYANLDRKISLGWNLPSVV